MLREKFGARGRKKCGDDVGAGRGARGAGVVGMRGAGMVRGDDAGVA